MMMLDAEHDVARSSRGVRPNQTGVPGRMDAGRPRRPSVSHRWIARGDASGRQSNRRHGGRGRSKGVEQRMHEAAVVVARSDHS